VVIPPELVAPPVVPVVPAEAFVPIPPVAIIAAPPVSPASCAVEIRNPFPSHEHATRRHEARMRSLATMWTMVAPFGIRRKQFRGRITAP
jgi:hypothetical protein